MNDFFGTTTSSSVLIAAVWPSPTDKLKLLLLLLLLFGCQCKISVYWRIAHWSNENKRLTVRLLNAAGDGVRGDEPLLRMEFCGLRVVGLPNEF